MGGTCHPANPHVADMTRLFLVRHGPTHQQTMTGWRDVPADLSDKAALARLDAHLPQDALLTSSDLIRASATADALARGRNRLPPLPALREIHFGHWDGLHWSEVSARDPALSRAFWEHPGEHQAPGGESWNAATARAGAAVDQLLSRYPDRDLILVAHMGIILTQLARLLPLPATEALSHRIDPLSATTLTHDGTAWRAEVINHLP